MTHSLNTDQLNRLLDSLDRIAQALEINQGNTSDHTQDFPLALAYRWRSDEKMFGKKQLIGVENPQLISFDSLRNIDRQRDRIYQNTLQFVKGFPANNVLLTGSRGTGKSSLVRACLHAFHAQGLRLIEVEKHHLDDLPEIVAQVSNRPERFIVFCDDLSFEQGEYTYKGLKTVLDGSVAAPSDNVLIYATSNRKNLVSERMSENLEYDQDERGEVHPGDSIEEKISLAERFGLNLQFHTFTQDEYLAAAIRWLQHFGFTVDKAIASDNAMALENESLLDNDSIRTDALRWAMERGSRSGRVAWQFARDYAGRQAIKAQN